MFVKIAGALCFQCSFVRCFHREMDVVTGVNLSNTRRHEILNVMYYYSEMNKLISALFSFQKKFVKFSRFLATSNVTCIEH